jgi:hypothetical protein
MKYKIFTFLFILTFLFVAFFPTPASAGAYETAFTTSITYQNVDGDATTDLKILFYESPDDTTPIEIQRPNLESGAGTSLFVGSLDEDIDDGFQGTAVMVSDKVLVATLVQLPQGSTTVKNRPLSNGFSNGSPNSLIATVLKNMYSSGQYTIFSVQNTGAAATDVEIKFYDTSANLKHMIPKTLDVGAGYYVDTGTVADLGTSFNGSVVIDGGGGSIISSAMELDSGSSTGAKAFEGVGAGAMTFYMPSALCNFEPTPGRIQNTNFAVQNADLATPTDVTVTYSGGKSESKTVQPGAKASFNTCAAGVGDGYLGSATVTSDTTDIIAMGKAAGSGLSTAYIGFSSGSQNIALPYVRWTNQTDFYAGSGQRVNIAIQNVGMSDVTGPITVDYVDRDGVVVGTHTINTDLEPGDKANSNATNAGLTDFGFYGGGQYGGGAIISGPAGSELAAIARVATYVTSTGEVVGEDYNGMAYTPAP